MPAHFDQAPTARAKCRACGLPIQKGAPRLGDTFASQYAEGQETTLWYHPKCAAYQRPEAVIAALAAAPTPTFPLDPDLAAVADLGIVHRRLPRVVGAEPAPTGRAACRACKEKIEQASWRLRLSIFDTDSGRHEPMGFVHAHCGASYCDGAPAAAIVERARHFAPTIDDAAAAQLLLALTPKP